QVGFEFFRQMGYKIWVPPTKFEGEAELKHLHENVYAGGYRILSEKEIYPWMEEDFAFTSSSFASLTPFSSTPVSSLFPSTVKAFWFAPGCLALRKSPSSKKSRTSSMSPLTKPIPAFATRSACPRWC